MNDDAVPRGLFDQRVLALHLKRLFDSAGLPTIKPRDNALRAVTKEVGGRSRNRRYSSIPCAIPPPPFCTRAVCRLRWPRPWSGTTVRRSTKSTSRSGSRALKKGCRCAARCARV